MHRPTRLKITDVNPHLICILCGGYLIDATTMIECLHSYCRACIVAYLRQSRQCPICDTVVHKTRPLLNIRSDKTLQNLVYKLVPNLFKDEMKRRRDFYAKHPQASTSMQSPNAREERGEVCEDSLVIYTEDEYISLSLDYYNPQPRKDRNKTDDEGGDSGKRPNRDTNGLPGDVVEKRYLRCPAAVCITHIKKFIRNKFGLSPAYRIEVIHQNGEDEPLRDDYTLMDVAYIYTWRRNGPLPLLFRVFEPLSKRRKGSHSSVSSTDSIPTKVAGQKPSPSATRRQDSPSKIAIPSPLAEKERHFQKPHARVKTGSETVKVPAKLTKPSFETPGQSGKTVTHDRNASSQKTVLSKKTDEVRSTEKSTTSSANAITQSSSLKTSGKTIIIVTSAKPVSASSESVTIASSVGVNTTMTLSSLSVAPKSSPMVNLSSNENKSPPTLDMPSTKLDMPPSKADMTSSKSDMASPKPGMTSSKSNMTSSKSNMTSNLDMSSKMVMTSKPVDILSKPDTTPSKADETPSKADETPSKVDETPSKVDETPSKVDETPSKVDETPSKVDETPSKVDETPSKVDETPPGNFTLFSIVLAPTNSKDIPSEEKTSVSSENKTLTIPNIKLAPAERSETQVDKFGKLSDVKEVIATKQKAQTKMDQPLLQRASVTEDLNVETTPTKRNTACGEPMDVSVSDDVMIDRPVLLQT